jgi:hypothetical protein
MSNNLFYVDIGYFITKLFGMLPFYHLVLNPVVLLVVCAMLWFCLLFTVNILHGF